MIRIAYFLCALKVLSVIEHDAPAFISTHEFYMGLV